MIRSGVGMVVLTAAIAISSGSLFASAQSYPSRPIRMIVVVHPAVPAKSIQDLIAVARSKPDGLDYASSGNGGGVHLATELFKSMTGVRMRHVPFQGGAPGLRRWEPNRRAARQRNSPL